MTESVRRLVESTPQYCYVPHLHIIVASGNYNNTHLPCCHYEMQCVGITRTTYTQLDAENRRIMMLTI